MRRRVSRYYADTPHIEIMEDGVDSFHRYVPVTPPRSSSLPSPIDFPPSSLGTDQYPIASSTPQGSCHSESSYHDTRSGDSGSLSHSRSLMDSDDGASDSDASMSTAPTSAVSDFGEDDCTHDEELMSEVERKEFGPARSGTNIGLPSAGFGNSVLDFGTILCHPPLVAPSANLPPFAAIFPSFTPRTFRSMSCLKSTTQSYPVPQKFHAIPRKPVPSPEDLPYATPFSKDRQNSPSSTYDAQQVNLILPTVLVTTEEPTLKTISLQVSPLADNIGTLAPVQMEMLRVRPLSKKRKSWYGGESILHMARVGAR